MPGIFVDRYSPKLIQVKMPFFDDYHQRIRKIDGARWGGQDNPVWVIPNASARDLDEAFKGELIYITPRHTLLRKKPPKPPAIFKDIVHYEIKNLKQTPYKFQTFGANFLCHSMVTQKIAILGDLMGTGKTFQSLMASLQMKQQHGIKKVLIVVLASTRPQWKKEIAKFTHEDVVVFSDFRQKISKAGGKTTVIKTVDQQKEELIQSYKKSKTMYMLMSYQGFQQNQRILETCGFDMVIFDEAHYMNNKDSKTNRAAADLITPRTKKHRRGANKGIPYVLYTTGTPVTAYPDQIFGLVRTGNPKIFGTLKDFNKSYVTCNEYHDIIGYRNLPKLRRILQSFLIRRTDKELDMDMPKIIEEDIIIEPIPKQIKLDKELRDYQRELIDEKMNALRAGNQKRAQLAEDRMKSVSTFLRMASNHPNLFKYSSNEKIRERYAKYAVKDDFDIPKFNKCIEMVKEIVDNGYKVVIFTESRRMTGMLHKHIKQFTRAVRYIGGLSDEVRERRKDKFNNDPSCRVLIANGAGSTGLNLQAGKYLINYDLPDTPAIWEQRKYRIRRIDSTHDRVFIYNLINKDLVDQRIYTKLMDKQAAFDATVENDTSQTELHRSMIEKPKKKKSKSKG